MDNATLSLPELQQRVADLAARHKTAASEARNAARRANTAKDPDDASQAQAQAQAAKQRAEQILPELSAARDALASARTSAAQAKVESARQHVRVARADADEAQREAQGAADALADCEARGRACRSKLEELTTEQKQRELVALDDGDPMPSVPAAVRDAERAVQDIDRELAARQHLLEQRKASHAEAVRETEAAQKALADAEREAAFAALDALRPQVVAALASIAQTGRVFRRGSGFDVDLADNFVDLRLAVSPGEL